jgi:3-dehydroquinate synthase
MALLQPMKFDNNGKLSECFEIVTADENDNFNYLENILQKQQTVLITDENVFKLYPQKFEGWKTIVIKPGEIYKQQAAVDEIIKKLIELQADRSTFIVGVGGGVVTDIAGYAASVYMRGLRFGFVPTTILAMVDASIGGKNGVDVGLYKNLVGTINQPKFIIYDYVFLQSLPHTQWINGFAEIIKHAAIKDAALFTFLENNSIQSFKNDNSLLSNLIVKNVQLKTAVVVNDEFETGERKLLNFGHTFGHAIENVYQLPHGYAISIGMVLAASISEATNNFETSQKDRLIKLLQQYELPIQQKIDADKVLSLLKLDKKMINNTMNFILLNKIGDAIIKPIPIADLSNFLNN